MSAQIFPSAVAPATVTASEIEIGDDSITPLNRGDALTYFDNLTSYLMPDNTGKGHVPDPSLLDMDNGEPGAAGPHPHQRLTRTDLRPGHLFESECPAPFMENHCFHTFFPITVKRRQKERASSLLSLLALKADG
jgi:hypothetical protein